MNTSLIPLNKYIDHTLLKPTATLADIKQLCQEALQYEFKTVCVQPVWVKTAKQLLIGSQVGVCTVIGFPLGASLSSVKAFEAVQAINDGADELDMVINIGALKAGDLALVEADIQAVRAVTADKVLKVIIESCLLTYDEIILAAEACLKTKADFVKTSTGFSTGGATLAAVSLIKKTVKDNIAIKAAGGIRDLASAGAYIALGVSRLGTSSGVKLMQNEQTEGSY